LDNQQSQDLIEQIKEFLRAIDADEAILFGSRARGDALETSDVDLVVIDDKFAEMPFPRRLIYVSELDKKPKRRFGTAFLMQWRDAPYCISYMFLERINPALTGPDPYCILDGVDEYLSVTDLAGLRRFGYRLDYLGDHTVIDEYLKLGLGYEIHLVLRAAVYFRMSFLPAETLDFRHGKALDAYSAEGVFYVIEFERLDYRFYLFHRYPSLSYLLTGAGFAAKLGAAWVALTACSKVPLLNPPSA